MNQATGVLILACVTAHKVERDAATNRGLLEAAGFVLLHDELVEMREGGGGAATFQWVLARRFI